MAWQTQACAATPPAATRTCWKSPPPDPGGAPTARARIRAGPVHGLAAGLMAAYGLRLGAPRCQVFATLAWLRRSTTAPACTRRAHQHRLILTTTVSKSVASSAARPTWLPRKRRRTAVHALAPGYKDRQPEGGVMSSRPCPVAGAGVAGGCSSFWRAGARAAPASLRVRRASAFLDSGRAAVGKLVEGLPADTLAGGPGAGGHGGQCQQPHALAPLGRTCRSNTPRTWRHKASNVKEVKLRGVQLVRARRHRRAAAVARAARHRAQPERRRGAGGHLFARLRLHLRQHCWCAPKTAASCAVTTTPCPTIATQRLLQGPTFR